MMRIDAPWLNDPQAQAICAMLETKGYQALFVGGCVRNAFLGTPVADIDISTDARPEQVMALSEAAGFKAVPTGLDHGTITVVAGHAPYEITTFRRDVATDGRRAVVAFSNEIAEDAARRDFTMNALYADKDGQVIDPLGGLPDLQARRVRFIGTAQDRIREDYLRSLRYFRFHAWYGDSDAGMDAEALAAISELLGGLDQLSRERVGAETLKLLAAPDPATSVAAMRATGALIRLLPGADDTALGPLIHLENGMKPNALRRLAALGDADLAKGLRLSRAQVQVVDDIRSGALGDDTPGGLGFRLGLERAKDALLVRAALMEQPIEAEAFEEAAKGANAVFPVSAADLMPGYTGVALGRRLKHLQQAWIHSDFTLGQSELMALPDEIQG